jgi:hypothetical protein
MFECGNWVDRCLDMAHDAGYRLEWDRFGSKYCVSLYGDERHDGTGPTLDSAAFMLVNKLRPAPEDRVTA